MNFDKLETMNGRKLLILFVTMIEATFASSIEKLLIDANVVVEGSLVAVRTSGEDTVLSIKVNSVLVGKVPSSMLDVSCNGIRNTGLGLRSDSPAQMYFLKTTSAGVTSCLPVFSLGHSMLGYTVFYLAPACREGDLQSLGAKSTRERLLVRVAESALCGAPHFWSSILDAASPGGKSQGVIRDFDRRLFRELVKSSRRDIHLEAFLGLLFGDDPLPYDLLASKPEQDLSNEGERRRILFAIENGLEDPRVITQLSKIVISSDPGLRLAAANALQRFHTPATVALLGRIVETPTVERTLGVVAAKGLADFANGCPMTTASSFQTPADYFPRCDANSAFRTDDTALNARHNPDLSGDDDRMISYWRGWWFSNRDRVAAANPLP